MTETYPVLVAVRGLPIDQERDSVLSPRDATKFIARSDTFRRASYNARGYATALQWISESVMQLKTQRSAFERSKANSPEIGQQDDVSAVES